MHLENKSPLPVAGPFTVELVNMMVNLTGFRVEGAENGKPAEGARWIFAAAVRKPRARAGREDVVAAFSLALRRRAGEAGIPLHDVQGRIERTGR